MAEIRNKGLPSCENPRRSTYIQGCRCDECTRINAESQKQYRIRRYFGTNDVFVDAGPAKEKIRRLQALGYTERELKALGVYSPWRLLKADRIHKSTSERILAIKGRSLVEGQRVDGGAARFLISRWHDAGLTYREIGTLAGISTKTAQSIYKGENGGVRLRTLTKLLLNKPKLDNLMIERGLV